MAYEIGQQVRVPVEVRDPAGVLTNATMSFTATRDDGTAYTVGAPINDGTGLYYVDVTVDAGGVVSWRWTASGAVVAVYSGQFYVRSGSPGIVSLAEVKAHLNKRVTGSTEDDELTDWIDAVTAVIEDRVGAVVPRSVAEVHSGGSAFVFLRRGPVLAVTSVVETRSPGELVTVLPQPSGGPYTDDQYELDTARRCLIRRGSGYARLWEWGVNNIAVSYMVGRRPTPPAYRQAALELIAHHWRASQLVAAGTRGQPAVPDVVSVGVAMPHRVALLLGGKRAPLLGGR